MVKKNLAAKKRDWTPVANGQEYCSPACGMGCTMKAYKAAVASSDDLAKRLNKHGTTNWKPRVWENGGWHFAVEMKLSSKGFCSVHHRNRHEDAYVCYFNANSGQHLGSGDTAEEAIKEALESAEKTIKTLTKDLSKFPDELRWG